MNGRMYDPITKQMTSPDIFDQSTYFTQSYNRYTYALNNPMRFTDPSGYDWRLVGWAYSYQTDMDGNFESETWYPVKEWETKAYWEAGLNDNGRSIGGGFNGGFGGGSGVSSGGGGGGGGGSANYAGDVITGVGAFTSIFGGLHS